MSSSMSKKRVCIAPHAIDEFSDASINDAIKLGAAAFESATSVRTNATEPRSCGWQLISYYYSGYFAANAIMRLCGHGCTNLSALECAEINERARLYGVGGSTDADKITPGLYFCIASPGATPTWNLHATSSKGGVHIQFWTGFLKFLANLETTVKASALTKNEKSATLLEIRELVEALKHGGVENGSWLSEVRNAMNYRLEYGVWHPYDENQTDGNTVLQLVRSTLQGTLAVPKGIQSMPDPERACRISAFLMRWLKELAIMLEDSSGGKRKAMVQANLINIANTV